MRTLSCFCRFFSSISVLFLSLHVLNFSLGYISLVQIFLFFCSFFQFLYFFHISYYIRFKYFFHDFICIWFSAAMETNQVITNSFTFTSYYFPPFSPNFLAHLALLSHVCFFSFYFFYFSPFNFLRTWRFVPTLS